MNFFRHLLLVLVGILAVSACARTEITQTAKNQAVISTSAAPACGEQGALRVANEMAAVATLRQGYERFLLGGVGSSNDVRVTQLPGSHSYTSGNIHTYGNTAYGNFQTYTPTTTIVSGRNRAQMQVYMLNPGDQGYDNALDAKELLGADWQKKVEKGISSCK